MTDLLLLCCFIMFATAGLVAPFVFSLGYLWVDSLLPHMLSYGLLSSVPMALILGAGAVFSYIMLDRRAPPRITGLQVLCGVQAIWMTLTLAWAVAPDAAVTRWDPAFKTVVFTIFLPFVFRTRVQIEAFVLVLLASTLPHLLPWGIKTSVSGGGYGLALGLLQPNAAWIAESSGITAIATMLIPLLTWVRQHSLLIPWKSVLVPGTFGLSIMYLIATVGTYARTGIVAIGILGIGQFFRSKRKFAYLICAGIAATVLVSFTTDKWTARIDTIGDGRADASSNTRVLVWEWTWQFAKTHPLGGGFAAFTTSRIEEDLGNGEKYVQLGRAYHNIYFSNLGDHGYPGLAIYLAVLTTALLTNQGVIRQCKRRPELEWAGDLARAGQLGLVIMMACGMFIDVSFTFVLWDLIALTMCLRAHVSRVLAPAEARIPAYAPPPTGARPALPVVR